MGRIINGYKIFVYNKRSNMISMLSRNGRYLSLINGQI